MIPRPVLTHVQIPRGFWDMFCGVRSEPECMICDSAGPVTLNAIVFQLCRREREGLIWKAKNKGVECIALPGLPLLGIKNFRV